MPPGEHMAAAFLSVKPALVHFWLLHNPTARGPATTTQAAAARAAARARSGNSQPESYWQSLCGAIDSWSHMPLSVSTPAAADSSLRPLLLRLACCFIPGTGAGQQLGVAW